MNDLDDLDVEDMISCVESKETAQMWFQET